jgi:hypothetical protein
MRPKLAGLALRSRAQVTACPSPFSPARTREPAGSANRTTSDTVTNDMA